MCMVYIYFYINPLWSSTIIILQLMGHCACYIAYISNATIAMSMVWLNCDLFVS